MDYLAADFDQRDSETGAVELHPRVRFSSIQVPAQTVQAPLAHDGSAGRRQRQSRTAFAEPPVENQVVAFFLRLARESGEHIRCDLGVAHAASLGGSPAAMRFFA